MTDHDQTTTHRVLSDALMEALGPEESSQPTGWMLPPLYQHEADAAAVTIATRLHEAGYRIERVAP